MTLGKYKLKPQLNLLGWENNNNLAKTSAGKDEEELNPLYTIDGDVKRYTSFENYLEVSCKLKQCLLYDPVVPLILYLP